MAKVTFDGLNKLIIINTGVTTIDVGIDMYSEWKKWVLEGSNSMWDAAFRTVGGDIIGVSQYIPTYYFLINTWKVKVENLSVNFSTNLYSDDYINPFIITNSSVITKNSDVPGMTELSSITYNIENINTSLTGISSDISDINIIMSGISDDIYNISVDIESLTGITSELNVIVSGISDIVIDINQIIIDLSSITYALSGLTGLDEMARNIISILGLSQHNYRLRNHVYDSNNRLTFVNIKLYNNSSDCDNDVSAFETYEMRATYNVSGNLTDYKVIKL